MRKKFFSVNNCFASTVMALAERLDVPITIEKEDADENGSTLFCFVEENETDYRSYSLLLIELNNHQIQFFLN